MHGFSIFEDVTSVSFLKCTFTISTSAFILPGSVWLVGSFPLPWMWAHWYYDLPNYYMNNSVQIFYKLTIIYYSLGTLYCLCLYFKKISLVLTNFPISQGWPKVSYGSRCAQEGDDRWRAETVYCCSGNLHFVEFSSVLLISL